MRGSTAFAGNVDTIAALSGPGDGSVRGLNRVGRCFDNVDPLALEYSTEAGYTIRPKGERDLLKETRLTLLREVVKNNPDAGKRKLSQLTGIPEGSVYHYLQMIEEEEEG